MLIKILINFAKFSMLLQNNTLDLSVIVCTEDDRVIIRRNYREQIGAKLHATKQIEDRSRLI